MKASGAAGAPHALSHPSEARTTAVRVAAPEDCGDARRAIRYYQRQERLWRDKMGAGRSAAGLRDASRGTCPRIRHLAKQARTRALAAARAWHAWFRRTYEKWRCIHEHEGAWNSNTGNGYYGGLQMTTSFQMAHGREFVARWGWAHRWPVWAQLVAAERAWKADGESFREWGTRGMCGL